ncbi:MAG: hypothetical protein JRJ54_13675 [Deltaproteobacteria bacterium]|nr:hypothetical protein [Deltaproteobacteria bacterium]
MAGWNWMSKVVHENAVAHGWWEGGRNDAEMIALMHSELSEALEAMRAGNPESEKLKDMGVSSVEEELADVVIRIMDFAEGRGFNLGKAILKKMKYNKNRPYKHGKRF